MGTVENIVTNLVKMGQDKRSQASQRYNDLSAWLTHEVSLIRALIETSPRNSSYGTASEGNSIGKENGKGKSTSHNATSKNFTASSSSDKNDSKDADKEKSQRLKRKSPETRQTGTALSESPDLKRNSLDYEELAVEAGLPADLNRLRKEQLLNELEKRGCADFSMKSLKKELIDGLRNILAENSRYEVDTSDILVAVNNEGKAEEPPASPSPTPPVALENENIGSNSAIESTNVPPPAPTSVRSSLLSSMRSSVGKVEKPASPEVNEEQIQERAANEFEARQSRSQFRKSVAELKETSIDALSVPSETVEASNDINAEVVMDDDKNGELSINNDAASEDEKYSSPVKEKPPTFHTCVDKISTPEPTPNTSTPSPHKESSMEIISPSPINAPVSPVNTEEVAIASTFDDSRHSTQSQDDGIESLISAVSESSAESSAVVANATTQKDHVVAINESTSVVENKSSVVDAVEMPKKPLNLISAQTSFLPGSKPKPVIPALQQAARAKEAEAAKALQREAERKRKEQEAKDRSAKPAVPQAASAHGSKPVNNVSKSNLLKPTMGGMSKQTQNSTVPSSKSNVAAAVKSKGGIMGFIKKTFTTPGKEKAPKTPEHMEVNNAGKEETKHSPTSNSVPISSITTSQQQSVSGPTTTSVTPHLSATESAAVPIQTSVQASIPAVAPASQKKVNIQAPVEVEYEIEDRSSSGSDDSGTDDDKEDRRKNTIPDWARGAQLKEALEKQFGFNGHTPMDPDTIFYEVQTCSLEDIFGQKEGRSGRAYAGRSSSAKWDADEISVIERRKYRQQMGYTNTTPVN